MSLLLGPYDGVSGNCILDCRRLIIVVPVALDHHAVIEIACIITIVVITIAIAVGVRHGGCLGVSESLSGIESSLYGVSVKRIRRRDVWIFVRILFRFWRGIWNKSFLYHVLRKDGELVLQAIFFRVPVKLLDGKIELVMSISH